MRFTRIIAGTITAGLVGLVPVAISSPASAATTYTTAVTITASAPGVEYGDDITINGAVTDTSGGSVFYGTASLQVYTTKTPVWTTIQTDDTAGSFFFFDVKPESNAQYKVVYSGFNASNGDVYTPSESAPATVGVQRTDTLKTKGLVILGKIKPDFANKKVVIKRKKGKKYVAWKKIKTNNKGAFRFKAPNQRGFKFSVTVPSDTHYFGFTKKYYVY
ncbi:MULTISPECIES: hypothetical protein [Nocardioides]|uniref:hypothetical protein n=1 Tax=Nocardioides TaxID=1839 RepID=UPI000330BA86|nr:MULTISPECIES: hypothetical protein [Nocardioides]EON22932.1 hypothetical protein CF8_3170 [Nocardioides sp. CF8]